MRKTRLSLFYLVAYLTGGGIGLLAAPQLAISLLLSNGIYPDVMLRALGMFMMALAALIVQIIRHRLEALYPTTLIVRLFLCLCLVLFYWSTCDPLFLVLLAIVGLGVLLTGLGYLSERNRDQEESNV